MLTLTLSRPQQFHNGLLLFPGLLALLLVRFTVELRHEILNREWLRMLLFIAVRIGDQTRYLCAAQIGAFFTEWFKRVVGHPFGNLPR